MPRKNIIVFGQTGSGKSSVINLLFGRKAAPVSDGAIGCTSSYEEYKCPGYTLYDTSGFSEGSKGTVSTAGVLGQFGSLFLSLTDGLNLLIYVIQKGRILDETDRNYSLIVHDICEDKVPVILVITHCEFETRVGTWWRNYKRHFDIYGMNFIDVISGYAGDLDTVNERMRPDMAGLRCEMKAKLERSIASNGRTSPWKMRSWKACLDGTTANMNCPPGLKNIIVFGAEGSGKSSIVNLILGSEVAKVPNPDFRYTFKFSKYKSPNGYTLCETEGLSEDSSGQWSMAGAMMQSKNLMDSLSDGVSLLIMVMNRARITRTIEKNYQLFVDHICLNKVPVLLVIPDCETEMRVGTWWQKNQAHFNRYNMKFAGVISGCAADPCRVHAFMRPLVIELRSETKAKLEENIYSKALRQPWKAARGTGLPRTVLASLGLPGIK